MTLKARVTTSMKAQLDEEMDLNEGEIVTITGIVDKTWYRGVCGDRQGIFPKDFVELLSVDDGNYREHSTPYSNFSLPCHASEFSDFSVHDSGENFSGNVRQNTLINFSPEEPKALSSSAFSSHDFSSTVEELSDVFSSKARSTEVYDDLGISPYGITLYPFYGQFDNELSFHEGEIVTLLRHIDNDWIEGEIEGRKGIMPVSYVNIVVDCEYSFDDTGQTNSSQSIVTNSLKQNAAAKVMYNFHAQMDGDISIKEGEEVFISELVNDNWCRVKNSTGMIGLCPLNYLSPVIAPKDPFSPERCPSNDGLPMYKDIFMAQDSNVEIRKPSTTVDPMSNIFLPLSSNRPSSIDDMIAKNIVGLDFDCKTNKSATSDEIKSHTLELRTRKHSSTANTSANVCVDNNQNSKIKPERPKPPNSRLSLPAILSSTSATPTHGAIETKEDVLYSEVQKRKSVQEFPKIDSVDLSLQELADEEVIFRRQGSDRVPHRPAPPIPVPGQTPVRRSLKRNITSSKEVMSK
ncbi:hypothetical protein J437_LFUL018084 [Ladona fulva]|uniref:SH3 domain-containing protein n=1 Tax=Ladona fulva TaxID=123851 RepID=A0A8K0KMS5_LADFU|nr:hypothetical protein J437_LFUL018084 [Ladona fulva]